MWIAASPTNITIPSSTTPIKPDQSDPEEDNEEEGAFSGGFKYRTKIDARRCFTTMRRDNNETICHWFESIDKTFTITPDQNTLNALLPASTPKKVILRANGEREWNDWPGEDFSPIVFCES